MTQWRGHFFMTQWGQFRMTLYIEPSVSVH